MCNTRFAQLTVQEIQTKKDCHSESRKRPCWTQCDSGEDLAMWQVSSGDPIYRQLFSRRLATWFGDSYCHLRPLGNELELRQKRQRGLQEEQELSRSWKPLRAIRRRRQYSELHTRSQRQTSQLAMLRTSVKWVLSILATTLIFSVISISTLSATLQITILPVVQSAFGTLESPCNNGSFFPIIIFGGEQPLLYRILLQLAVPVAELFIVLANTEIMPSRWSLLV